MSKSVKKEKKNKKGGLQEISRDCTINLAKRLYKTTFKKKAPKAISEIVKFAKRNMLTDDVRVDTKLNQFLWSNGVRNTPRKVRVRLARRKNEDEETGKGKFYTLVTHIPVDSFDRLLTEDSNKK